MTPLLIAITIASVSSCANTLHQQFDLSEILPAHEGRIFSVNTKSPVAVAIRNNQTLQKHIEPNFSLLDIILAEVLKRRRQRHVDSCNFDPGDRMAKKMGNQAKFLQLGHLNLSCITAIDVMSVPVRETIAINTLQNAKEIIRDGRRAFTTAAFEMILPVSDNWTDPNAPFDFVREGSYPLSRQSCSLEVLRAYWVNDQWYIRAAITNHDQRRFMPDGERHIIREWVPRSYSTSLQMVQPNFYNSSSLELSTTVLSTWSGFAQTLVPRANEDPTSTISDAYSQSRVDVELASDSVTVSNIAILALPMAMNVIPVAFITEMNTVGLISYVIITDIFSTIPFLIKGIELIRSSRPRAPVVSAFYGGNETFGDVRVLAVECTGEMRFRATGIVFVGLAILALVLGFVMEVWAHRFMERRKEMGIYNGYVQGPFGAVMISRKGEDEVLFGEKGIDEETIKDPEWWKQELHKIAEQLQKAEYDNRQYQRQMSDSNLKRVVSDSRPPGSARIGAAS